MDRDAADFLATARDAAAAAADILKHYYRGDVKVELKPDQTPVTQADIEAEQCIKKIILERHPEHGWYGEESGQSNLDSDWLWLVDPLDGTKSFVRGYPFFSTQIALMVKGQLYLGVSCAPVFDETAWAVIHQGAWINDRALQVSGVNEMAQATVSTGNIRRLAASSRWPRLGQLLAAANRSRGYGDFYHYHLLAAGSVDVVLESEVNILDIAALSVIVTAAGGQVTDLDGAQIGLHSDSVLATNGRLHAKVQAIINE